MSVRSPIKFSTITRRDEEALATHNQTKFSSFEETFKPRKSQSHQKKSQSPKKSPQKHFVPKGDSVEGLTRSEILARLEMKEQEEEKEIDLNETSITGSNVKLAKSKNDLSRSLISNLDNEVDGLKAKRSVQMAERDKMRKEQIKRALEEEGEDQEAAYASGQHKSWKVSSVAQTQALENFNEVLRAHQEKMEAIEKQYAGMATELVANTTDKLERMYLVQTKKELRKSSAPAGQTTKTGKENLKNYSKLDPPPLMNSYMVNPFLLRKKRETPQEKKLAELKAIKNKRDDLKNYKERFVEYLEDKKEKVERGKEEPSPDQLKREGKMEFRLKGGAIKKMSLSPKRVVRAESPKKYPLESSPSHHLMSPSNQSVKKLPPRRFSERKSHRATYGVDRLDQEELVHLVWMFNHMKKGEKPTANKEDIWNYIMKNTQAFEPYNVDLMNLKPNLYEFPTEFPKAMSLEEFVAFLRDPKAENDNIVREVIFEIEALRGTEQVLKETYTVKKRKDFVRTIVDEKTMVEVKKLHNKFENLCLLSEDQLTLFKQVFHKIVFSFDESKPVNRVDFVKRLREDENVQEILGVNAVHVNEYDEFLTVDKVLRQIENEYRRAPGKQKKLKENITLSQLLKYFTNYELNREVAEEEQIEAVVFDDGDTIDTQPDRLQFFKDIFGSLPKSQDGQVETEAFIQYIYGTEFYKGVCGELAREKGAYYELPRENIEQTMARIEREGDLLITWEDFKQHFTRRGRPLRNVVSYGTVEGSRHGSKILDSSRREGGEAYKKTLRRTLEEEGEESDDDIHPTISAKSKYMRYNRQDKDVILNKKAFKAALEAAEQEEIDLKALQEEEDLRKKVYGSKFGALYKDNTDFKITTPNPFSFDHRDKHKGKSIRERKLEEMLLEKEQVELEPLNVHFQANTVPAHVKVPLYDHIMRAQEERRERVRQESKAITSATENPFSFYQRDMEKFLARTDEAPLNAEFDYQFKAKKLPDHVLNHRLWSEMQTKENADREVRIANLAKENAKKSSLPPRMAHSEKRRQEKGEVEKKSTPKKVFRANPIPDFENLHKEFQGLLDAKRKSKKPSESKPFNFQESRKGVERHYLNVDNQMRKAAKDQFKRDPFEAVAKLKATKPKLQPATTKKMLAMMDKLKEDREELEMRKMMKKMEEENRLAKYKKMKPRVQTCGAILDMAKEKAEQDRMIKEEIRLTMKENEKKYRDEMRQINDRVEARPLLVEQEGERNLRNTQERALREMMAMEGRDPRMIDPMKHLTKEQRAYYEQQAGYLRGEEEYEGVAEEEEGEDEDDEQEQQEQQQQQQLQQQRQLYQQQQYLQQQQQHLQQQEQGEEEEEEEEEQEGGEREGEGEEGEDEEGEVIEYEDEEAYRQALYEAAMMDPASLTEEQREYLEQHIQYLRGEEEYEGVAEEEGEDEEEEEGQHHHYQHQHHQQHHGHHGEEDEGEEGEEGEEEEVEEDEEGESGRYA